MNLECKEANVEKLKAQQDFIIVQVFPVLKDLA